MNHCYTCELIARRDAGDVPLWDAIYRGQHWDVVHSYNTSLAGWLVLVARRHMTAIAEMNDDEAGELGLLLRRMSIALQQATGCAKTYVIQFAEAAEHPHVHFHVVPRMADQPEDARSMRVFRYLGVAEEERVGEARMNELAAQIQRTLKSFAE